MPQPDQYYSGGMVYRRLLSYSMAHARYFGLAILGMAVYAPTDAGLAYLMKLVIDDGFVDADPVMIRWLPLLMVMALLVRGLGNFLSTYFMSNVGQQVVKRLRGEMFNHLLHAPVSYFDSSSAGQLVSKITYNVQQVATAASQAFTVVVRDTLTIIALLALMFYHNWVLTLTFLLTAPLIAAVVVFVTRRFRRISHRIQSSMGDITHVTEEMISGHKVVKIFGGHDYENHQFDKVNDRNRMLELKMVATKALSTSIVQFIVGSALAGIIFVAFSDSVREDVSAGTFVSFIFAMAMLLTPARRLTMINESLQKGIAAGQSIFQLLDTEQEFDQSTNHHGEVSGEIEFRDVQFRYDVAKGDVLKGISFKVKPGETVALVGRSGSGKSTLVNLVPRFYEPASGEIFLDGINIRELGLAQLREQITYVGQDVVLFNDSIANNIAYGRRGNVTSEQLLAAAEAAHIMEFINKLPEGMETLIGDNGVLLSGGQRQRLAIARAVLKDAPILILDEATSSLDAESERHIQAAFDSLLKNRTTLVIAHRLSTVENADRIIVMGDGQIIESGTHNELLARKGAYASLYQLQLREPDEMLAGKPADQSR